MVTPIKCLLTLSENLFRKSNCSVYSGSKKLLHQERRGILDERRAMGNGLLVQSSPDGSHTSSRHKARRDFLLNLMSPWTQPLVITGPALLPSL